MNTFTRLVIASGAGLILALTASPALAANSSDSRSNPAQVEHVEYNNPDGTFSEYRGATRYIENEYYTTNTRDRSTVLDDDGGLASFDDKTHYMLSPQVIKMNSNNTFTEDGVTCRSSSQFVSTNGVPRTQKTHSSC
jgi:hypothetical protein